MPTRCCRRGPRRASPASTSRTVSGCCAGRSCRPGGDGTGSGRCGSWSTPAAGRTSHGSRSTSATSWSTRQRPHWPARSHRTSWPRRSGSTPAAPSGPASSSPGSGRTPTATVSATSTGARRPGTATCSCGSTRPSARSTSCWCSTRLSTRASRAARRWTSPSGPRPGWRRPTCGRTTGSGWSRSAVRCAGWRPPPDRGSCFQVCEAVLAIRPDEGELDAGPVHYGLGHLPRGMLPHRAFVALLTPLLDDGPLEAVRLMRDRGFAPLVVDVLNAEPEVDPRSRTDRLAVRTWRLQRDALKVELADHGCGGARLGRRRRADRRPAARHAGVPTGEPGVAVRPVPGRPGPTLRQLATQVAVVVVGAAVAVVAAVPDLDRYVVVLAVLTIVAAVAAAVLPWRSIGTVAVLVGDPDGAAGRHPRHLQRASGPGGDGRRPPDARSWPSSPPARTAAARARTPRPWPCGPRPPARSPRPWRSGQVRLVALTAAQDVVPSVPLVLAGLVAAVVALVVAAGAHRS